MNAKRVVTGIISGLKIMLKVKTTFCLQKGLKMQLFEITFSFLESIDTQV